MSDIKLADHNDVSVLNFRPFLDGSNKQEVADALFASMKDSGFVYLVNHGLPQDKIDGMFEMVSPQVSIICRSTFSNLEITDTASQSNSLHYQWTPKN